MRGSRYAVAFGLLLVVWFAACSDALTGVRRADITTPVAVAVAAPAPIIVAAGDIAECNRTGDEATALLLDSLQADAVLALGDLAYDDGTATEFNNCYDPTWGRHKSRTFPSPGNHEYHTPGAEGYFNYFGAVALPEGRSYYSFNLGDWHILSLNSNISASPSSAQIEWIRQDLAAHPNACSLAYWHHPVRSSGEHGNVSRMREAWRVLDSAGVDVVLAGHDHNYERFAPQTATGIAIGTGIRQFVVGTGGRTLRSFSTIRANSEVRNSDTWGVLKLTLNATSYAWEFVPVAGKTFTDQGTADCVQTTPPEPNQQPVATLTEPADGATFAAPATITLRATASDVDGNLNRVEFYRGSSLIGSDGTAPYSITWRNVAAGTYTLRARAVDAAEAWTNSASAIVTVNPSAPNSAPTVTLTAPAHGATFTVPAAITLEAAAADVDGNLSRVEFYQGTTLLGSDATAPYAFTWTNVAAGSYVLTARAIDASDATGTSATVQVTVNLTSPTNQPPVANPGGPYTGWEGVVLTVAGSGSSDPENDALTYAWDFGDGTTATGPSPSKTYADNGSYTITLVVSDPSGASSSATTTATIANIAPRLTFSAPATVASGEPYTLAITSATDVAADLPGLQYRFDCGSGYTPWGPATSVTCPGVIGPATRTVRGAVGDEDGGTRSVTGNLDILAPPAPANSAPTVTLTAPAHGATFTAPATITLAATAADVDGNLSRVEFYRGTTLLGSDATAPYAFTWTNVAAGSYVLTARAIDASDATGTSAAVQITVNLPPAAYFLVLDDGTIKKDEPPNRFTASDINYDLMDYATRRELRWFAANVGRSVTLYSGSVGNEGFHALKTIPASWNSAGPTTDGLRNYLVAGPGLGSPNASGDREALLGNVPNVTPLRATGLRMLVGQPVCAVVKESNVATNYSPLSANLKGKYLGIIAFVVDAVTPRSGGFDLLPAVSVTVRDADVVCPGPLQMLLNAPAPTSSSEPRDTGL